MEVSFPLHIRAAPRLFQTEPCRAVPPVLLCAPVCAAALCAQPTWDRQLELFCVFFMLLGGKRGV